jgi:uncharacterized membrane protein
MSEQLLTSIVTVITAIIGVAILAVLVSKQSNTSGVLNAAARGLSTDLSAALSPITGGGGAFNFGGVGNGLLTNFGN